MRVLFSILSSQIHLIQGNVKSITNRYPRKMFMATSKLQIWYFLPMRVKLVCKFEYMVLKEVKNSFIWLFICKKLKSLKNSCLYFLFLFSRCLFNRYWLLLNFEVYSVDAFGVHCKCFKGKIWWWRVIRESSVAKREAVFITSKLLCTHNLVFVIILKGWLVRKL